MERQRNQKNEMGITLVALVITIIVLLILAGVTITTLLGENGIIKKAQKAKEDTESAKLEEQEGLKDLEDKMDEILGSSGPQVTIDGTTVTLTKENVAGYLGKKVTNYKTTGGTETVSISGTDYTVSTTYRLYYVDFDSKYGDGAGTVYLKADCTSNNTAFQLDSTELTSATESTIKIKALNPHLYKGEAGNAVTSPAATHSNMKAVTWLTNTTNWEGLKTSGASTEIGSKVNYVVGSPCLEMMMDSYNTHYGLTEDTPNTSTLSSGSARVKLFYKYPLNSDNCGYAVGPSNNSSATDGYYRYTSYYTVQTDSTIDTMYYPGSGQGYWLASPSGADTVSVIEVHGGEGGFVSIGGGSADNALCPLVSLESGVQLVLE